MWQKVCPRDYGVLMVEGYVGMAIVGSAVVGFIAAAAMWARRR